MRDLAELNNTIPVPSETQAVTEWLQKHRATVHFGIGLDRNKMIIEWQPEARGIRRRRNTLRTRKTSRWKQQ